MKHKGKILGLIAVLLLALFAGRIGLFLTYKPAPEGSYMEFVYDTLGIEAAPVVERPVLPPKQLAWSFEGALGQFDKAAARRGLQVYREVCAVCHGLDRVAFRNLTEIGYSEDAALEIAQSYQIEDGPDDFGEMFMRAGRLSDYFPNPFRNENEAKSMHGGKVPPDLSLMAKARADGPNYIYSLLTGYVDPPADFVPNAETTTYNPYFDSWEINMPPPLFDGGVEYADGTEASVEQMSKDLVEFMMWTAEPNLDARHEMGFKVIIYMAVLTLLLFLSMRVIWRRVKK